MRCDLLAVGLFVMVVLLCGPTLPAAEPGSDVIRVMSFNIRYGSARDGENHWDRRRDLVTDAIRTFSPDLLGTQETLDFQKDYIATQLPEYEAFGVGRDDGSDRGEMTAVFVKRARFERVQGGHFWLSETPDKPGSISWDSSLTRMCTWVKLRDRLNPEAPPLWFFNTHLDHRGPQSRIEAARLIRRRILDMCGNDPVVVTGDFNAGEGSEPYRALFGASGEEASPVIDSYRKVHPERSDEEATYNGFKADARQGGRIDWIATRGLDVESATIDRSAPGGKTPSDHWPVTVVLKRSR